MLLFMSRGCTKRCDICCQTHHSKQYARIPGMFGYDIFETMVCRAEMTRSNLYAYLCFCDLVKYNIVVFLKLFIASALF